jgi:tetratricopeptide (TPR) repeat protein
MKSPMPQATPAKAGVLLWAVCIVLGLAGCATPQTEALRHARPVGLPATRSLALPYFAQQDHQCGPAALAMVLAASGETVTPAQLAEALMVPARKGSLPPEMMAAPRRLGRLSVQLAPRLEAVLAEVAAGTPVIVLQNLGLSFYPLWHYAVVVGYDLDRGVVVLQSGGQPAATMPMRTFENTWARSGFWAMVAVEPERLPAGVPARQAFEAAANLERVDPRSARLAYRAITRAAPELPQPWIGLGNAEYQQGDLKASAIAFRRATQLDPANADAWNNLASVLAEIGHACEAASAAARAIALGGPHRIEYESTAASLKPAACDADSLR